MVKPVFFFETIIWQPTTLCNMNCRYCYLPGKENPHTVSDNTVRNLAKSIDEVVARHTFVKGSSVTLVWHGGEPLTLGKSRFAEILEILSPLYEKGVLRHSIVTNGTLIDDEWVALFKKYQFEVGVSLDGPEWANINRVDKDLRPAFRRIMKGIDCLRKHNYPFYILAVVTPDNLNKGKEIYNFLASTGAHLIGFNFVEQEGAHQQRVHWDREKVVKFWQDLYLAWKSNPETQVREFDSFYKWVSIVLSRGTDEEMPVYMDLVPTVSWTGKVTILSPELATTFGESDEFVAGDINRESLGTILQRAIRENWFVKEYLEGVNLCQSVCPYFDYCLGGTPANKYFENGSLRTTETQYCRVKKQWFLDALFETLSI